jgi:hypothetical protein
VSRQHPVRGDLALPDGWKVTHHATVQVLDHPKLHPAELPVRGQWRAIDQAPDSGWWLQPKDDVARRWLQLHGQKAGASSGMVNVHRLRLVPWWLQLPLPGT